MRALRICSVAIVLAVTLGAAGCVQTVVGTGTLAAGGPGPGPSGAPTGPDPSSGEPTPSPTPTVDPVKTKEQVTCVLVQASVKTTNDKFNAAKTRDQQISVLSTGRTNVKSGLDRSGLPHADRIYAAGQVIYTELSKLLAGASKGASPSTAPYNNATNRFRTACLSL
jgi:hypothetical protein